MTFREFIKQLVPPLVAEAYERLQCYGQKSTYGLSGNYRSWNEAVRDSTGYDSESILEKTRIALLKVKNGEAVCERDSVLFDQIQYSWPLLAGLMWVAAQSEGRLNVLDFGGSLGSTYFQNRQFLRSLHEVRWNIVEQPRHVHTGRQWFEDDRLRFFQRIEDCLADTQPNVVVLSSVLQYLERPYDLLTQLLRLPCKSFLIDRTPFWDGPADRLCVQKVPPSIYPASYPSWIFSKSFFSLRIEKEGGELVAEFESPDRLKGPVDFTYRGMILVREIRG